MPLFHENCVILRLTFCKLSPCFVFTVGIRCKGRNNFLESRNNFEKKFHIGRNFNNCHHLTPQQYG